MTGVRQSLTIAGVAVLRVVRDRGNLFFVFVFPLLLVLLVGSQFGVQAPDLRLGVVANDVGELGEELVDGITDLEQVTVEPQSSTDALLAAVDAGEVDGGLVLPDGYDDALRAGGRQGVVLEYVATADGNGPALQALLVPVVGAQSQRVALADTVRVLTPADFATALAEADAALGVLPDITVERSEVGSGTLDEAFAGLGRFDLGAVQQLLLFVFLTSLTSAAALLQSREYGVTRRLLAHPTTAGRIVRGEALGRLGVGLVQGLYMIVGTRVLFGVDWGNPVASVAILLVFATASAGAGLLVGAMAANQSQAAAVGIGLGLAVAAFGGSMLPLELIPDGVRTISWLTPHAWAYDAYAEVLRRGGGLVDVLPQLGVIAGMAAVLLGVAATMLRRRLTA